MMARLRLAVNPQQAFEQVVLQNSGAAKVAELIRQNNGNAQQAFYNYAKQLGIDPDEIMKNLN